MGGGLRLSSPLVVRSKVMASLRDVTIAWQQGRYWGCFRSSNHNQSGPLAPDSPIRDPKKGPQ